MRVCLVARRFYESNTHIQQFAHALSSRGDEVDVIVARRPGYPSHDVAGRLNIYRIRERNIDERSPAMYLLRFAVFLIHAMCVISVLHIQRRYDLIHVQSVPDVLVFSALIPKLLGTPVILDLRDVVPELCVSKFKIREDSLVFRLLLWTERICASFADHVIVANPIWLDRVVRRSVSPYRCSMIWYGPDPEVFHPVSRKRTDGKFVMMYPGTLSWHQGVDLVVKALPKILCAIPETELHIYGDGAGRGALLSLAERLGVEKAVRMFDVVPTAVLVDRMASSDVGVVPKRASERFGNEAASTKIPEFMAVGVPVIASRTEIESRLFDGSQVCFFQSEDEDDLLRAVVTVYSDDSFRERLRRNAAKAIQDGAVAVREQYLRLVDSLTEAAASGREIVHTSGLR